MPRGVVFHGHAAGAPSPHTIHWHGIEPTPLNDGVGHCSMEFGSYTFQWKPNFIGSYFYHCHRNTVQHFEFGLYGFLIIEPPDAYTTNDLNRVGQSGQLQRLIPAERRRLSAQDSGQPDQVPAVPGVQLELN